MAPYLVPHGEGDASGGAEGDASGDERVVAHNTSEELNEGVREFPALFPHGAETND